MKYLDWNVQKNEKLKRERTICFEEIANAIEEGNVLAVIDHPNKNKYPGQRVFVINIDDYAYLIPFVEDEEKIFLKTIIPSRKMTKKYIIKK